MEHQQPSFEHLKVLREKFKCQRFKDDQWKVIRSLIYDHRDISIVASTGFGKSLTYQFPPVFLNKIALVISPLISLMHDQVASLQERGISATFFCSEQTDKSIPAKFSNYNIIYLTPEALLNSPDIYYNSRLVQTNIHRILDKICLIAIDEAHVVDQWRDFRPVYRELYKIRETFPGIPIMTLTATCPIYVEKTILQTLRLQNPFILRTTLNRPNLRFEVRPKSGYRNIFGVFVEDQKKDLLPIIRNHQEGSLIIYVIRISDSEEITQLLNDNGITCKPYHSAVKQRKQTLEDFRSGKLRIVVCTIAFGMGIDRQDVRCVIHYGMPRSIEGYYQEAGRAGRDGKKSKCILFYSTNDVDLQKYLIKNPNHGKKQPNHATACSSTEDFKKAEQFQQEQFKLLNKILSFVQTEKCRRMEILVYLGAKTDEYRKLLLKEDCCDNCQKALGGENCVIPLNMLYQDINAKNSTLNLSDELRILLCSIIPKMRLDESLDVIVGRIPKSGNHYEIEIEIFGMGRNHEIEWWKEFALLIKKEKSNYLTFDQRVGKEGKKILRNKTHETFLKPTKGMRKFMQKRIDLDYYWEENEVKSRPKVEHKKCDVIDEKFQDQFSAQEIDEIQAIYDFAQSESNDDELSANDKKIIEQTMEGLDDIFFEESYDEEPPAKIPKLF